MKASTIVFIASLPILAGTPLFANSHGDENAAASNAVEMQSPGTILAAQVSEIAATQRFSVKQKSTLISRAVRNAVVMATSDITDSTQVLKIALELAAVAAKAAPKYANVIGHAVTDIPSIMKIDGSAGAVVATVEAAAAETETENVAYAAPGEAHPPSVPDFGGPIGPEVVVVSNARVSSAPESNVVAAAAETPSR